MATFVAMATLHEKIYMTFLKKTTEPIIVKFHIKHLGDGYTRLSKNRSWSKIEDCRHAHIWYQPFIQLLQNHWDDLADTLHEAYGAPPYMK